MTPTVNLIYNKHYLKVSPSDLLARSNITRQE
jgi:hypothetical protein